MLIWQLLGMAALGALTWSFLEYWIHRELGHIAPPKLSFTKEHLAHHKDPSYFAPTRKKVRATAMFAAGIMAVLVPWLALELAGAFTVGFLFLYTAYEIVHRRVHTHAPIGFYGRWTRRHHYYHHFNNPKMNHGVTSPVWDILFRTHVRPKIIQIPERFVMPWLLEPSGEIRAKLKGDYEVFQRRARPARPARAA
ncbi:MAG: sterol desaturase family protein [Planctomycetota bacterium]|jgi:sterol desaturase/sphingolipid hydroxylase (fatty acid hydroxylase superfamily)